MNGIVQRQEKSERLRTFSERLRSAMEAAGESNSALAKKIGTSHTSIGRWLKLLPH
jgi:ribosome-binding protein aMBF1 (putative translation factor)